MPLNARGEYTQPKYCECPVPNLHFQLPNGSEVINEDERFTLEPPKEIDHYAIGKIKMFLSKELKLDYYDYGKWEFLNNLEQVWQTNRGNYPKRLGAAGAKAGHKIPSEVLTKVGNIARAYDTTTTFHLEASRDFNTPVGHWGQGFSCWWSFCSDSRCRMKNWGGFGIRCFDTPKSTDCRGRMWVVALKEGDKESPLIPTHDSLHAPAYVIFNPKGTLFAPTHARIMTAMTGKPYKPIIFTHPLITKDNDHWRGLKSDGGVYLIADKEIAEPIDSLALGFDAHEQFDAAQFMGGEAHGVAA
jgi:hypothetical protein